MKSCKFYLIAFCAFCAFLFSCSPSNEDEDPQDNSNPPENVSNTLHLSFHTPDWNRLINCEHLDLFPIGINENTSYVSATSQSTGERFFFSIPRDSSEMVSSENNQKYPIREFGENSSPFEFSQLLPVTPGSSDYLVSKDGLTEDSFNEVVEINYIGNEENYALFTVKCRYKMMSYEIENESIQKPITGTFHLKVRTSRQ